LNILEKQGWYPGRTYDISRELDDSVEDYLNSLFDPKRKSKELYTNPRVDEITKKHKEVIERMRLKYPNNKIIG
jgi:mevalonate pyrophosphate decarboxylase